MDWKRIAELRQRLHQRAEISGREEHTAQIVSDFVSRHSPDTLLRGLGGHGVAAVFEGSAPGPTVLLRAELDALPIREQSELEYRSSDPAAAHLCGHDGHAAILLALVPLLSQTRPSRGRVVLLFQPEEETGQGAQRVTDDERFDGLLKPDYAFALHNLPGYPAGEIVLREGAFATASIGMTLTLDGKTSHAGQPEQGRSPALAVAHLIESFSSLASLHAPFGAAALCTVVGASVGPGSFGTTPGTGEVRVTLRAATDSQLDNLSREAQRIGAAIATSHRLEHTIRFTEHFPAVTNDVGCVGIVENAARVSGLQVHHLEVPFPWSEDFSHFGKYCRAALFGLGSGTDQPALHHPTYDFPDAILKPGAAVMAGIIRKLLSWVDLPTEE